MESSCILVTGLPESTTKTDLVIYFQSTRDSGGGDVKKIEIEGGHAFITFEEVQGTYHFTRIVTQSFGIWKGPATTWTTTTRY